MARLPIPGQDDGTWGEILNDFLSVEHNGDGTLKDTGSIADKANDIDVVHTSGAETIAGTKTFQAQPVIPDPLASNHAASKSYVDNTVADITKADVGLGNVDNTSDANKPISNATQAALNGKVDAASTGAANGVASLDSNTKIPAAQIPDLSSSYSRPADIQIFTSSGNWTKPAGASMISVVVVAGGGGGGSGRRGAPGTVRCGGGGGAGGGITHALFPASSTGASESISVGVGGTGGAGRTTDNLLGEQGIAGGNSAFGILVNATGGGAGAGGNTSGSSPALGGKGSATGGSGGANSGTGGSGGNSPFSEGPTGGGGGGGIQTNDTPGNGGGSFEPNITLVARGIGGTQTAQASNGGSQPINSGLPGSGGGGGCFAGGVAQPGGNGGLYGSGGGGGAASPNGTISGAGGNGADGIVIVTTYF